MYFTENETTTTVGQCKATCLRKTTFGGKTIVTWELLYPRYIHAELMTHRVFSRNAASSRATPIATMVKEVRENPVFFDHVGLNKAGMVSTTQLSPQRRAAFEKEWKELGNHVADMVESWFERYGIHKQVLNRALEPWLHIRTLVTATDLKNFFNLRLAKDAQPEMRNLAKAMKESMEKAKVKHAQVHLPYKDFFEESSRNDQIVRNIAACGRVCIARNDGKTTTFMEDQERVQDWARNGHMSPLEHVAVYDGLRVRNLDGWRSIRALFEDGEVQWLK